MSSTDDRFADLLAGATVSEWPICGKPNGKTHTFADGYGVMTAISRAREGQWFCLGADGTTMLDPLNRVHYFPSAARAAMFLASQGVGPGAKVEPEPDPLEGATREKNHLGANVYRWPDGSCIEQSQLPGHRGEWYVCTNGQIPVCRGCDGVHYFPTAREAAEFLRGKGLGPANVEPRPKSAVGVLREELTEFQRSKGAIAASVKADEPTSSEETPPETNRGYAALGEGLTILLRERCVDAVYQALGGVCVRMKPETHLNAVASESQCRLRVLGWEYAAFGNHWLLRMP